MIDVAVKLDLHFQKVIKRETALKKRVLYRQGGYLKTTIARSMRYSKNASKPGRPPNARRNNPKLRELTSFSVDEAAGSVIAGPEMFSGSKVQSNKPLPELLDDGGDITAEISGVSVTQHIAPRPFIAPVFTDGGENFRKLLEKDSL